MGAVIRSFVSVCLIISLVPLPAWGQAEVDDATFLHVLLVIDTNEPDIGKSVQVDLETMQLVLRMGVPANRYRTTVLDGPNATPDKILTYYRNLGARPTDSLLCYYAGHAAWDSKSHYLMMHQQRPIRRTDIVTAMQAKQTRLNILLTDCCSIYTGKAAFMKPFTADPYIARDLLFRHRGTVDITAARRGQAAIGNELKGGYFTVGLSDLFLCSSSADLDRNRDGKLDWAEAFPVLTRQTQEAFEMMKPRGLVGLGSQAGQTPYSFGPLARHSGRPIPVTRERIGIRFKETGGRGLYVTTVVQNSPAEWAGIVPGDVLVGMSYRAGSDPPQERYDETPVGQTLMGILRSIRGSQVVTCFLQQGGPDNVRDVRLRLSH